MIEVLLSTQCCRHPKRVAEKMNIDLQRVSLCIVNQEASAADCRTESLGPNLRMLSYVESGLSRSRNRLLDAAVGDICVISDDDVIFLDDAWDTLEQAHCDLPDSDLISFRFRITGTHRQKKYPPQAYRHTWRTLHRVASIEISFKRSRLPDSVRFDERFGLGTKYPRGAECIFLNDLRRAGLKMHYQPTITCEHAELPTGRRDPSKPRIADAHILGKVARRMYPTAWPLFVVRDSAARVRQGLPLSCAPGYLLRACRSALKKP